MQSQYPRTFTALLTMGLTASGAFGAAGPAHVVDRPALAVTSTSASPQQTVDLDGVLIYSALHPLTGRELWRTDGTGEATLVADICPGREESRPWYLAVSGGLVYFTAWTDCLPWSRTLWSTDGTPEGTQPVADAGYNLGTRRPSATLGYSFVVEAESLDPWAIGTVDARAVFLGDDRLWTADADAAEPVSAADGNEVVRFAVVGDKVFFGTDWSFTRNADLRVWDTSGVRWIETLECGAKALREYGDAAYFVSFGRDGYQHSLYRTDGTTVDLVAAVPDLDERVIPPSGDPIPLCYVSIREARLRDEMIFASDWLMVASDGTAAGTRTLLVDACGDLSCELGSLAAVGKALYAVVVKNRVLQLWRTIDGNSHEVVATFPGLDDTTTFSSRYHDTRLVPWNSGVAFAAPTPEEGLELWFADAGGARLLGDLRPGPDGSRPRDLVVHDGKLFFTADAPANGLETGRELWVADGAGVRQVLDIFPGPRAAFEGFSLGAYYDGQRSARLLASSGGELVFGAADGIHGVEFWTSDGTAEGTRLVEDLVPGPMSSSPRNFRTVALRNADGTLSEQLFWNAGTADGGYELWTRAEDYPDADITFRLIGAIPPWTPPGSTGTFSFVITNHGPADVGPPESWLNVATHLPLRSGQLPFELETTEPDRCPLGESADTFGNVLMINVLVHTLPAGESLTCELRYRVNPAYDFTADGALVNGTYPLVWKAQLYKTGISEPALDPAELMMPFRILGAGAPIPTLGPFGLALMAAAIFGAFVALRRWRRDGTGTKRPV